MTDPRYIAASIVGAVDWQTDVSGFSNGPQFTNGSVFKWY